VTAPSPATQPRVGHGFRLQWEPVQNCHVLRSVAEIVSELERAFSTQALSDDVLAFVEMAGKQRWLTWD
jgi:pyrroloquinoline quinone biosynthesis protein D